MGALVQIDEVGQLHLSPSALSSLRGAASPTCILSVVGPAGEGKTTLAKAVVASVSADGQPTMQALAAFNSSWLTADTSWPTMEGLVRTDGAWMWIGDAPPAHASSCGSIVVIDTSPITGSSVHAQSQGDSTDAAQQRLLAFLQLTSSRVVINVRRQPRVDFLKRLLGATVSALKIWSPEPTSSCHAAGQPVSSAVVTTSSSELQDSSADCARPALAPPSVTLPTPGHEEASRVGSRTELVMLLRDAHHLTAEDKPKPPTDYEALRQWLPGVAADAIEASASSWRLEHLPPPTETDLHRLDLGGRLDTDKGHHTDLPGNGFAQRLSDTAYTLTRDLQGVSVPGFPQANGAALTTWMEHVVGELNEIDFGDTD